MATIWGEQGIELYHARVVKMHNPSPHPLHGIYMERQNNLPPRLYPGFREELCCCAALSQFIAGKRAELFKLGIQISKNSHSPIELHAVSLPKGEGVLLVCSMECLDPATYARPTNIAHLFRKVGNKLGTPSIGWPQKEDRTARNSFLSRAVMLHPRH